MSTTNLQTSSNYNNRDLNDLPMEYLDYLDSDEAQDNFNKTFNPAPYEESDPIAKPVSISDKHYPTPTTSKINYVSEYIFNEDVFYGETLVNTKNPKTNTTTSNTSRLKNTYSDVINIFKGINNRAQTITSIFSSISGVFSRIAEITNPTIAKICAFVVGVIIYNLLAAIVVFVSKIVLMVVFAGLIAGYLTTSEASNGTRPFHDYVADPL